MNRVEQKRIQIARSRTIYESRVVAELALKEYYSFLPGEVVMVNYYKEDDPRTAVYHWQTGKTVGVLVAVGIKEGIGEDCYRLLSVGGQVQIIDVVYDPDDVTLDKIFHDGDIYLYIDTAENKTYYVYLDPTQWTGEERVKQIVEVTGGPFIFISTKTGYRWFYSEGTCKREDDFFNTTSLVTLLEQIKNSDITIQVTANPGSTVKYGTQVTLTARAKQKDGSDVSGDGVFSFIGDNENLTYTEVSNGVYRVTVQRDSVIKIGFNYTVGGLVTLYYEGKTSLYLGYYVYHGILDSNGVEVVPNENAITKVGPVRMGASIKISNIDLTLQRFFLAYPAVFGNITHVYDANQFDCRLDYEIGDKNSLGLGDWATFPKTEDNVSGFSNDDNYRIARKIDAVSVAGYSQDFRFNASNPSDPGSGSEAPAYFPYQQEYENMLTAWNKAQSGSGLEGSLIMLDSDGKIPEEYYSSNVAQSFTEIEAFTDGVLDSGMIPGKIYYDTQSGKLYTAQTSTTSIISEPQSGIIYSNDDSYYTADSDTHRLVVFSSNVQSVSITHLTEILT